MLAKQSNLDQRLALLADFAVLDTPLDPAFDGITKIASIALVMPIALVSFVEEHRQWFKSEIGVGCRETPYESSVCAHAIHSTGIFEIEDLTLDARTVDNPLVTGEPHARFYAGAVLRTSEGISLGTVCVLDTKPRRLSGEQREVLMSLARQTMALLELRRSLNRAHGFEKSQSHFMAIKGHDLRQPLQIISASTEMALRKTDSEAVKKHLNDALDAVSKLGQELEELAVVGSRGREGELGAVNLEPIKVETLLDSLSPAWNAQACAKGLRLDVTPSPVMIHSDRRLLSSILNNLVGNSIKYTVTGGISITCRTRDDGSLSVAITDTGIGMTKAEVNQIFAPFAQLNTESDGLGLGLALVKQAADYLNYRIVVSSSPGVGSRFSFSIPIEDKNTPKT